MSSHTSNEQTSIFHDLQSLSGFSKPLVAIARYDILNKVKMCQVKLLISSIFHDNFHTFFSENQTFV